MPVMRNRKTILLAVIASAILALLISFLTNLAATYLAPSLQNKAWWVYGALVFSFLISLPLSIFLFKQTLPSSEPISQPLQDSSSGKASIGSQAETHTVFLSTQHMYRQLLGRDQYVGDVMAALRDPSGKWMIGIDGMGGIGKTALAREVAVRCGAESLFSQVIWLQAPKKEPGLRGGSEKLTFDTVMDAIARQLGALDLLNLGRQDKTARIGELLHSRHLLVVLDNLETASVPQDEIAGKLLPLLGPSKAVLTSRHRFKGDLLAIHLSGLREMDAFHLIAQEAEDKGIEQAKNIQDDGLKSIAKATGGSPLAIKFVVGQLSVLPLETVLRSLEKVQTPKDDGDEGDYVRFYKKILLPSWKLLSVDAKKLLITMANFEPQMGGTLSLIQQTTRLDEHTLTRQIDELWRFSFLEIQAAPSSEQMRYYLHPLTHHFVMADIVRR